MARLNHAKEDGGTRCVFAASSSLSTQQPRSRDVLRLAIGAVGAAGVRCVCLGFWLEQAHADQPAVIIDALDDISVQLEL